MNSLMLRDIVLTVEKYINAKNINRSKDIDIENEFMDDLIKL